MNTKQIDYFDSADQDTTLTNRLSILPAGV